MSLMSAIEFLPGTSMSVQGIVRLMCQASDEIPNYLCETPCKLLSLSDQVLRRALRDVILTQVQNAADEIVGGALCNVTCEGDAGSIGRGLLETVGTSLRVSFNNQGVSITIDSGALITGVICCVATAGADFAMDRGFIPIDALLSRLVNKLQSAIECSSEVAAATEGDWSGGFAFGTPAPAAPTPAPIPSPSGLTPDQYQFIIYLTALEEARAAEEAGAGASPPGGAPLRLPPPPAPPPAAVLGPRKTNWFPLAVVITGVGVASLVLSRRRRG